MSTAMKLILLIAVVVLTQEWDAMALENGDACKDLYHGDSESLSGRIRCWRNSWKDRDDFAHDQCSFNKGRCSFEIYVFFWHHSTMYCALDQNEMANKKIDLDPLNLDLEPCKPKEVTTKYYKKFQCHYNPAKYRWHRLDCVEWWCMKNTEFFPGHPGNLQWFARQLKQCMSTETAIYLWCFSDDVAEIYCAPNYAQTLILYQLFLA